MFVRNRFVNLGFDRYHVTRPERELVRMEVITNRIGNALKHTNDVNYTRLPSSMSNPAYLFCALSLCDNKRVSAAFGNWILDFLISADQSVIGDSNTNKSQPDRSTFEISCMAI